MSNHKTTVTKAVDIKRAWHLVDLKNATLGRISTDIAIKLMGKNKPMFTPSLDCGDYVIVINAKDVKVTGRKGTDKKYQWHSTFPGGFKETTFNDLINKDPRKVIDHAIKGMLPKNKLRAPRLKRLKVFAGAEHPYQDKIEIRSTKSETKASA